MRENLFALCKVAFVVIAVAASSTTLTSCEQRCEKAANCLRKCDCLNSETNQQLSCPIAFRCEGDTGTCEDAYNNFSCEQICADYAATARCGVARCATDDECTRVLSCANVDANGQPNGQFRDCTFTFACELDKGESCEPASSSADAVLCAACPQP